MTVVSERPLRVAHADRRGVRRRRTLDEHGILNVRVRPGRLVNLMDVSAHGALVESARQLRPGAAVEVQMSGGERDVVLRGFVLRCTVSRLGANGVVYRAAIGFDRVHPWFSFDVKGGYGVHVDETAANNPSWAPASPLGV